MPKLSIPQEALPGLKAVINWDEPTFQAVTSALERSKPALTGKQFSLQVSELTKAPRIAAVIPMLLGLYAFMSEDAPLEELVRDLTEAVSEAHPKDFPANSRDKLALRLNKLLGFKNSLGVTAKAWDIMTESERVFCEARVLSDIRPVFGDSTKSASAAVIIHNLQIGFHDSATGEHKELYFALDNGDVQALKKVLDRAEQKATALKLILESSKVLYLER